MSYYWILLLAALLLDVLYLLLCTLLWREPARQVLLKMAVALVFPFGGVVFFVLSGAVYQLFLRRRKDVLSVEDLSFRKYKIRTVATVNMRDEMDRVPMAEALVLSDKRSRRAALLGLLKTQKEELSLPALMDSLRNEDSEVSHYAATALNEVVSRFQKREYALEEQVRTAEPEDRPDALSAYVEHSRVFLAQGVLSTAEQAQYENRMAEAMAELVALAPDRASGEQMAGMIEMYLRRGEMAGAGYWTSLALEQPDDPDIFNQALRYHHRAGHSELFFALLQRVKASTLVLDSHLLDIVRFYSAPQLAAGRQGMVPKG